MKKRQNRLALHRETIAAMSRSGLAKAAGGDCTCTCCPTACGGACPTDGCTDWCTYSCDTCNGCEPTVMWSCICA